MDGIHSDPVAVSAYASECLAPFSTVSDSAGYHGVHTVTAPAITVCVPWQCRPSHEAYCNSADYHSVAWFLPDHHCFIPVTCSGVQHRPCSFWNWSGLESLPDICGWANSVITEMWTTSRLVSVHVVASNQNMEGCSQRVVKMVHPRFEFRALVIA